MKLHKIRNTEEIYTGKRENKEKWRLGEVEVEEFQ